MERAAEQTIVPANPVVERLHASVLDAIPDLAVRFNREQRRTYCNAACRAWFGFPQAPAGLSLNDLLGLEFLDPLGAEPELVLAAATLRATVQVFQVGGCPPPPAIAVPPHRRDDGTVAGIVATIWSLAKLAGADARLHTSAENTYRMSTP